MSIARLDNVKPGRLGIFSGALCSQPSTVQRDVAISRLAPTRLFST